MYETSVTDLAISTIWRLQDVTETKIPQSFLYRDSVRHPIGEAREDRGKGEGSRRERSYRAFVAIDSHHQIID